MIVDYLYLIIPALVIAFVGVRIMFCGHQREVRHDRRSTDHRLAQ